MPNSHAGGATEVGQGAVQEPLVPLARTVPTAQGGLDATAQVGWGAQSVLLFALLC